MFKTVLTLFRGSVAAAGEELEDRSALLILDQQLRDAATAVERSKRTLALAIAGDQQEARRLDATNARIADLEVRATRRGGVEAVRPYESTLPEAEKTLKRLRERQIEAQAADEALIELDAASGPLATAEKLAEQGFGPRLKSTADDVLARLNAKRTQTA